MQTLSGDFGMTLWDRLGPLNSAIKGVTAYTQMRDEICQADKYLTRTCIFIDADVFKLNKISKVSANRREYMKYL